MTASKKLIQAAAGSAGGDFYPYTIDNSARFDGSSDLSRTPSSSTSSTKCTFSCWLKISDNSGTNGGTLIGAADTYHYFQFYNQTFYFGNTTSWINTAALARDFSAWYHVLFVVDTTLATANDRMQIWVNGVRQATGTFNNQPTQNSSFNFLNTTQTYYLGSRTLNYYKGYLADVAFIDGTAYSATDFAEDKNGVWIPKDASGLTFGTNGFYLDFANSGALGTDSSGNGNNFTSSGLTSSDQMIDTPTSNFCTMNPLDPKGASNTLSEGNLGVYINSQNTSEEGGATFAFDSGKWYWETYLHSTNASNLSNVYVGIKDPNGSDYWMVRGNGGEAEHNGTQTTVSGLSWGTVGDIIGVAVDADAGTWTVSVNGTWISGDVHTSLSGLLTPFYANGNSANQHNVRVNFGQDSTFAGNTAAGGNTDANGNGDFKYAVPTDHLALCTANLPEPTIGPNSDENVTDYFNTVLYTGNGTAIGSGGKSVTGVGFQPNMVWTKNRDAAQSWAWMDTQMGSGKYWTHNYTSTGVITNSESLSSMDADGFTVGNLSNVNVNAQNYVAYAFKERAEYFDIVGYSGTGSVQNIAHGLGVAPNIIIVKRVTNANTAPSYFNSGQVTDPQTDYIGLFDTGVFIDNDTLWNDTAPTSTQFTVGTSSGTNLNVDTYIAYLFANMDGVFKTGVYTGNGSSNGPFVYTNFIPSFLAVKRTNSADNWIVLIVPASESNGPNDRWLNFNNAAAEGSSIDIFDLLSNGFKLRSTEAAVNASGGTYIYMAFAENPFKYSNAR